MKAEIVTVFCLVMGGIAFIIIRGPTYSNPKASPADLHACVIVSMCHTVPAALLVLVLVLVCVAQYWHAIILRMGVIDTLSFLVQLYSQTLVERHDLDRARAAVMGAFVADAATMGLHW